MAHLNTKVFLKKKDSKKKKKKNPILLKWKLLHNSFTPVRHRLVALSGMRALSAHFLLTLTVYLGNVRVELSISEALMWNHRFFPSFFFFFFFFPIPDSSEGLLIRKD